MLGLLAAGMVWDPRTLRPIQKTCSIAGLSCIIHSRKRFTMLFQYTPGAAFVQGRVIHSGKGGKREQGAFISQRVGKKFPRGSVTFEADLIHGTTDDSGPMTDNTRVVEVGAQLAKKKASGLMLGALLACVGRPMAKGSARHKKTPSRPHISGGGLIVRAAGTLPHTARCSGEAIRGVATLLMYMLQCRLYTGLWSLGGAMGIPCYVSGKGMHAADQTRHLKWR